MIPLSYTTWLRRRLPELCGAAGGIAFGLGFLHMKSPENFLTRIVIVSAPDCGKSQRLIGSILADAELQRVFTPLSISDDDEDSVVASTCEVAYQHVVSDAPWFRIAGAPWVCNRLTEAARQYHASVHFVSPVWVHDGSVVDVNERDRLLESAGYDLLPDGTGVVVRNGRDEPAGRAASVPPGAQSEWRGEAIGF